MFVHNKSLQFEVRVTQPDPRFASLMLEQFGGANGELTAALQYFTQAFVLREKSPKMYDLLMDIATEELSHRKMKRSILTMIHETHNEQHRTPRETPGRAPSSMPTAIRPWTCVATSPRSPGRRSSTNTSSNSPTTPVCKIR